MNKLIIVALLITLSGCATGWQERDEQAKQNEVIRLGEEAQNPNKASYRQAANDGCSSAKADGGIWGYSNNKDIDSYVNNDYYKTGYDDGYKKCKAESDRIDDAWISSQPYRW